MKLFRFETTELNGEQEYTHYHLVWAKTEKSATKKALAFCKTWYGDPDVEYDKKTQMFEFFGGCIVLSFDCLQETTLEDWQNKITKLFTI